MSIYFLDYQQVMGGIT